MQTDTIRFPQERLVYSSPAGFPLLRNGLRHRQITVALSRVSREYKQVFVSREYKQVFVSREYKQVFVSREYKQVFVFCGLSKNHSYSMAQTGGPGSVSSNGLA